MGGVTELVGEELEGTGTGLDGAGTGLEEAGTGLEGPETTGFEGTAGFEGRATRTVGLTPELAERLDGISPSSSSPSAPQTPSSSSALPEVELGAGVGETGGLTTVGRVVWVGWSGGLGVVDEVDL